MIPYTQIKNKLVHAAIFREKYKVGGSLVGGADGELLVIHTNVAYL